MELVVYAPVWGQSGMEKLSRELLLALDQIGVAVELRPDNEWNQERLQINREDISRLSRMVNTRVSGIAPHVICQLPKGQYVHKDAPVVCYSLFETDRCPSPWVDQLRRMDHVFVFSEFNRLSWINSGIPEDKISTLPQAVDSFMYNPGGPVMQIENKKGFTFLCSGDFTERKNFEAVVEAFVTEFTDSDSITLIFKCHYGGFTKPYRRDCVNRLREMAMRFNPKNPPRILFWGDKVSDHAMAALYRSVDCFVLCSRGEGLGMQYLEAMASGIPVIACDWGAQMDYLDYSNSYLVKSNLRIIDDVNYIIKCPQALNGRWCQAEIKDIQNVMRYVYQNQADAKGRAQKNLRRVREMTWQRMATAFIRDIVTMYDKKYEISGAMA